MKKILTLALAFSCGAALAQKTDNVGIGTTKPDPSAILDLNSNTKGLLLPRMNQAQRDAIKNPAAGLVIFQTDQVVGTYTFDGTAWQPSNARTSAVSSVGAWDKQGNVIDDTDFIGSTNDKPLVFKSYNLRVGFINPPVGNVSLGLQALSPSVTGQNNLAFGSSSQLNATTGSANTSVGTNALRGVTSGGSNVALGYNALYTNSTGSLNFGLGSNSLYHANGTGNVAIGNNSGYFKNGDYNIYIGNEAGRVNSLASESGKLYIHSAAVPPLAPLIGGDFINNNLKINVGPTSSATAGFLAIGDFTAMSPMNTVGGYRLIVQDGILTEKLKVAVKNTGDWADYVFEENYKLLPIESIETFIKENKHLPNVPSAEDMSKNGLDVLKMNAKLLEKIEELTLYVIKLNNEIKELKNK